MSHLLQGGALSPEARRRLEDARFYTTLQTHWRRWVDGMEDVGDGVGGGGGGYIATCRYCFSLQIWLK